MKSIIYYISRLFDSAFKLRSCLILYSTLFMALSCVVAEAETTESSITAESNIQEDMFEYFVANRKDPFVPFITEKATTTSDADMNEIVDIGKEQLTGMQLFEPGQLNLVALMKSGETDLAMVEDFTGKGYVISEGTKIGKRGVVIEIAPNKVVIEETAETRAGQKIVSNTVMVLKKEGEE